MKKRIFVQKSFILYFALLLMLFIAGACVYVVIVASLQGLDSIIDYIYLLFAICGCLFSLYTFVRLACKRIILKPDEIYVSEDLGNRKQKIQFEAHIKYDQIVRINLIVSTNNSLNKPSKWIFTPMPYLLFECENNMEIRINVLHYSKKQVIQIIDEVIKRAKTLNNDRLIKNGTEIFMDFVKQKNLIK